MAGEMVSFDRNLHLWKAVCNEYNNLTDDKYKRLCGCGYLSNYI